MTKRKLMTEFEPGHGFTKEDWDKVSEAEAEATDEELATARPFAEVLPELHAAIQQEIARTRGRPKLEAPKQQISIRLDPDVIAKFRATGPGWQARINEVLKAVKV